MPHNRDMKMTTIRVNGSTPMMNITFGWTTPALWKYAHVCKGSTVIKTFHGPCALNRAIRYTSNI